jgi:hypothetical protein
MPGLSGAAIPVTAVKPIVAAVTEDHVQDDVHIALVGRVHQVAHVLARAETQVDVQKVLDAVAVYVSMSGRCFQGD